MFSKIKSYATRPSTYVILALGAVIAFAFGRYLGPLKKVAANIPGSDAKTGGV